MSNTLPPSTKAPTRMLLVCLLVVALSSIVFPHIHSYGTLLFQVVVLGGWALVAATTSHIFADQTHWVVWSVVAALNVALFSLPALPVYFIFRRRASTFASLFLLAWLVFYVCCLFVLFPATDGP
jgi:hypothetical protein